MARGRPLHSRAATKLFYQREADADAGWSKMDERQRRTTVPQMRRAQPLACLMAMPARPAASLQTR
jgi:hypothetical protein